ncbi:MAG: CHRD domain-containing protein [Acidobacteriota bacterium]
MRLSTTSLVLLSSLAAFVLIGCDSDNPVLSSNLRTSTFMLSPANEVPPVVGPTSSGSATVTLDTNTNTVTVSATFTGLSSAPMVIPGTGSSAHVHQAAMAPFDQNNGGVVFVLTVTTDPGGLSGSMSATSTLDADQAAALLRGEMYINLHTMDWGSGELRGQITF